MRIPELSVPLYGVEAVADLSPDHAHTRAVELTQTAERLELSTAPAPPPYSALIALLYHSASVYEQQAFNNTDAVAQHTRGLLALRAVHWLQRAHAEVEAVQLRTHYLHDATLPAWTKAALVDIAS